MQYEIHGTFLQSIDLHLTRGESVAGGGLTAGSGRRRAGESLFMTTCTRRGGRGTAACTSEGPRQVWLQSLPLSSLAGKLVRTRPHHPS
jgi:uncharacterized protein (AIM24 family)